MSTRAKQFVAEDLWLLIAVLTLGFAGLAGTLGVGGASSVISIVGWFILTPVFMFWGEEIAAFVFEEQSDTDLDEQSSAVERLKTRYARGEIDEGEFERRLERLVETDSHLEWEDGDLSRTDHRRPEHGERELETED